MNVEPAAGLAERVTLPLGKLLEQVAPQEIPAGVLETVPAPVPALLTVSGTSCRSKVAVTVVAAVRETVQVPVPEQPPPLQPVKVEPAAGLAERVTLCRSGSCWSRSRRRRCPPARSKPCRRRCRPC